MEALGAWAIQPSEQLVPALARPFALLPARPQGGEYLSEHGLEQSSVVGQVGRIDGGHGCGGGGTHTFQDASRSRFIAGIGAVALKSPFESAEYRNRRNSSGR